MAIGATSFGSMLAVNSTLEFLDLFQISLEPDGTEALLGPLTNQDGHLALNKTLQLLHIDGIQIEIEEVGAKAIAQMLQTLNPKHLEGA